MKIFERHIALVLVLLAVFLVGLSIFVATKRTLTGLENTLLQVFSLIFGLAGSFLFGKHSAHAAAKDILKPHAKSAFRRLMSLYRSLSRVAQELEMAKKDKSENSKELMIERLDAIVIEQLVTADDAIEDWRDIVPEDVAEVERNYAKLNIEAPPKSGKLH